ncbi:MAG: hypothetical protein GX657_12960 [Chloroflexi bacterium]|nr:hypothetical protein [Chloroflexota bacterium]
MSRDLACARAELIDLDAATRRRGLEALATAREQGRLPRAECRDAVNMHCHTFYSYNGYGHSPSSLAWLAAEQGWRALATVDFDVLDGVGETLSACDRVAVRGASGLETRTYMPEFARWEINSPGEPGVCYHVGLGFTSSEAPAAAARVLREMRQGAERRNREMVARLNAHLEPLTIDYDRDVLPLTPAGNATERHILVAYDAAARRAFPERARLVDFWAARLGSDPAAVEGSLTPEPSPNDLIRSRLMKQGGVGYAQPDEGTFPPLEDVIRAIVACGAIPVCAWLDGSTEGEQHMDELLAWMVARGVGALNIIPERNWNYRDPAVREAKVRALYAVMDLARAHDLPVVVGTEMNKAGQPVVDDFGSEALRPLLPEFLRGADWIYGHTVLARALGRGYQSDWAARNLPQRNERNAFYAAVGAAAAPGTALGTGLAALGDVVEAPEALLARLHNLGA